MKKEIELFDLYGLWYEPFWHKPWFWPCLISLGLLLCVASLHWFMQKRKSRKRLLKEPWQEALEQLDVLRIQECTNVLLRKNFYLDLTSILKRYLIRRYGLSLESKTDEEILIMVKDSEFPIEYFINLSAIFNGALYVKFADQDAAFDQMAQDLEGTISIVKFTGAPPS
jgi:hypothetical protein